MAGCVPCFVIPLLLFIFHRYIQPLLLKFWNPWEKKPVTEGEQAGGNEVTKQCLSNWSCPCAKKESPSSGDTPSAISEDQCKLKTS